jgi:hypothetical protein
LGRGDAIEIAEAGVEAVEGRIGGVERGGDTR